MRVVAPRLQDGQPSASSSSSARCPRSTTPRRVVAPEADAPLELQQDLRRREHRRPVPADRGEDPRPQPTADPVQRCVEGVPLEGREIGRARAAPGVLDVHDRHHRSVTDQDVAGVEIGVDHVRRPRRWRDVGTGEPRRSTRAATAEEWRRQPGDSRFPTGGDAPGVRPVVVGLGGLAGLELDDLHQLLDDRRGQLGAGPRRRTP